MKLFSRLGLLSLVFMLGACGSTPQSNYYRLNSTSSGGSGDTPALGIGPIQIPEYLNRNAMVFNRGKNQLHIANFERWAEPLEEGVQRVLGLNLAGGLDTQNIRPFPWRASETPDYGIQLWLLTLDITPDEARLVAEWRVHKPQTNTEVARRISRYQAPVSGADGAALSGSYSGLLEQLSEEIAAAIRRDMRAAGG